MNTFIQMLAQSSTPLGPNGAPVTPPDQTVPDTFFLHFSMDELWKFIVNISWMQAVVCVAFATIYLIYGWRVFRALVIINFVLLGMIGGKYLGARLGSPLWGGIMGAVLCGVTSWPFMKVGVSILGAMAGAVLGAAIWRSGTLPDPLMWCGALAGLIAGGFLAFSSFKMSIMLFTSLQGAVFLAIGMLALLNGYPDLSGYIAKAVYSNVFFLPALVILPTLASLYCQQKLIKQEKNWAIPE